MVVELGRYQDSARGLLVRNRLLISVSGLGLLAGSSGLEVFFERSPHVDVRFPAQPHAGHPQTSKRTNGDGSLYVQVQEGNARARCPQSQYKVLRQWIYNHLSLT